MQKFKRCKRRGCPHVAFYAGYCRQCMNPLIEQPVRYWPPPGRRTATQRPDETRKDKP